MRGSARFAQCIGVVLLCLWSTAAWSVPFGAATESDVPSTRTFSADFSHVNSDGYAEVIEEHRQGTTTRLADKHRIWFTRSGKYRVESHMGSSDPSDSGMWDYQVYDGREVHVAWALDHPDQAKWATYDRGDPWVSKTPRASQVSSWEVADARLVGRDAVLGLETEHWRGVDPEIKSEGVRDLWLSTGLASPLVLKVVDRSEDRVTEWRITKLDLGCRVPDYMFTAQVDPKPEFLRLLMTPDKPPAVTILWQALILLAYVGGVACFVAGRPSSRVLRIVLGVAAISAFSLLTLWQPNIHAFAANSSGTPVILARFVLTALCIVVMLKVFRHPSGATLFRGSYVLPVLLMLGMVYYGMKNAEAHLQYYPGLQHSLRWIFIPAILVNVLLWVSANSALEELVFRGYIFSRLASRFRNMITVILLQAVIFAVYHTPFLLMTGVHAYRLVLQIGWLSLFGMLFGILRWRYRNLAAPWLVHFGYNAGYFYINLLYLDYINRFIIRS